MRTANYIFSVTCVILGILLILFVLTQTTSFTIGTAIGLTLVINGIVRLWFTQDED